MRFQPQLNDGLKFTSYPLRSSSPLILQLHHPFFEIVHSCLQFFSEDKVRKDHVSTHLWDDHSNYKNEEETDNTECRELIEIDHERADQDKGK